MSDTSSVADVLLDTIEKSRGGMATQIPGTVLAYDRATQSARVQPYVMARQKDANTDVLTPLLLPVLDHVPVMFLSGSGGTVSITWDLTAGDPVILEVCDRSIDEWKSSVAGPVAPQNTRRFDLSDAVAFPGTRPLASPLGTLAVAAGALVVQGNDIRWGSSAATSDIVLDALLAPYLAAQKAWQDAHVHTDPVSGVTSAPTVVSPTVPSVASAKVKSE